MAICNVNDLVNAGKCFAGLGEREQKVVITALLCQILQQSNPMASCDTASLLNDGKCFAGLSDKHIMAIQTQLLCEILQGGGTGGTCLVCGDGAPTEEATCDCSIYYSLPPNGGVWVWDSTNSVWDCILEPGP